MSPCKGIEKPADKDIVLGRGGFSNSFPGNQRYQCLVLERAADYAKCNQRAQKIAIGNQVIDQLHREGARFLRKETTIGLWVVAGERETRRKVSQRLRERAKELVLGSSISKTPKQSSVPRPPAPLAEQISRCTVLTWDEDLVDELQRQTSLLPRSVDRCNDESPMEAPALPPLQVPPPAPLTHTASDISVITWDDSMEEELKRETSWMGLSQTDLDRTLTGFSIDDLSEAKDDGPTLDVGALVPIVVANAMEWRDDE